MKKSILLFIALLVSFFTIDRLVYLVINQFSSRVYTGQSIGKINHFLEVKDSVDLIIFGNSRALHHVNTNLFNTNAYNIGVDGTKLAYTGALLSTLEKKDQTLLIHVDHSKLLDLNYNGDDCLGLNHLIDDYDEIKKFIAPFFLSEIVISELIKSYRFNGKVPGIFKNYFMPSYEYRNYTGYDPIYPSVAQKEIFENLLLTEKEDRINININKPLEINPLINKIIDHIINKSQENDSKIIFFTSPSLNKVDQEVKDKIEDFFLSKGVDYIDYIDFFEEFNKDYWKDFTHLSAKGADLFTEELKGKINQIK
ncbi:hypothetical protein GTQ40_04260 [Flavobacteriaceae bacterium R38]|nr:hypothetical protein [Flavobacteriaceae bacterium R38]